MRSRNSSLDAEGWRRAWEEAATGGDRAAGIVGDAILEHGLLELLSNRLAGSEKHVSEVLAPGGRGIGTRRAANLAFSLGLISKTRLTDLLAVNEIRNRFAHQLAAASFSDPAVIEAVSRLTAWKAFARSGQETPREQFDMSVSALSYWLTTRAATATRIEEAKPSSGTELKAEGFL